MNLRETYNRIAENWHRDHTKDDWWMEGTNKFISFLKPGELVLDVGCGGGVKSKYLSDKGLNVIGIDFAEKLIDIAKKNVPEATFSVMDLKNADTLEQLFDGIFMQAVLLHIPKKEAVFVLQTLASRLKKGGYFYVAVKEKRAGGADEEIKSENDYGYPYERFFSYFTLAEIKEYMKIIDLEVQYENVAPTGKSTWIQVIAKK